MLTQIPTRTGADFYAPNPEAAPAPLVLSERERRRYSAAMLIHSCSEGDPKLAPFEREVSAELTKRAGIGADRRQHAAQNFAGSVAPNRRHQLGARP